jgi:hypothetical protein
MPLHHPSPDPEVIADYWAASCVLCEESVTATSWLELVELMDEHQDEHPSRPGPARHLRVVPDRRR